MGLTEFTLEPESLLILHTDGIDECHYRQPELEGKGLATLGFRKLIPDEHQTCQTRHFRERDQRITLRTGPLASVVTLCAYPRLHPSARDGVLPRL